MEFMVVVLIEIMAILISIQIVMSLNKDYRILASYLGSSLKGREAIDAIAKDCRMAARVMDYQDGYVTTDNCLILKVPSIDASRNIIDVNEEFDYIIYRMNMGDLWKTVMPGPNSSRASSDSIFKRSVESLYIESNGVSLSGIVHKSSITHITIWISVVETLLGKEYRVNPGTTVKLMNYEWEYIR